MARVGGIIRVSVDGSEVRAKGDFTYGLGTAKREGVIGAGYPHGFKETPQLSFIEGALTDTSDLDAIGLCNATNSTVILELPNGKSVVLREAWFAAEGEGSTGEGEMKLRYESAFPAEVLQ